MTGYQRGQAYRVGRQKKKTDAQISLVQINHISLTIIIIDQFTGRAESSLQNDLEFCDL